MCHPPMRPTRSTRLLLPAYPKPADVREGIRCYFFVSDAEESARAFRQSVRCCSLMEKGSGKLRRCSSVDAGTSADTSSSVVGSDHCSVAVVARTQRCAPALAAVKVTELPMHISGARQRRPGCAATCIDATRRAAAWNADTSCSSVGGACPLDARHGRAQTLCDTCPSPRLHCSAEQSNALAYSAPAALRPYCCIASWLARSLLRLGGGGCRPATDAGRRRPLCRRSSCMHCG